MIRRLKAWLKKSGNTHSKLSELLGFSSRSVASNWIRRGSIPSKYHKKLKEVFNGNV